MEARIFFSRQRVGLVRILQCTFRDFFEKGGPTTAAAIAYFTLITLFPAFLLLVALGDKFVRIHGMSREVAERIINVFPEGTRLFITTNLDTLIASPSWGSIVTYASIFLWAGLWVFHIIEEGMDKAWNVRTHRHFLRAKLLGLAMMGTSVVNLVGSVVLLAVLHLLRARLGMGESLLGSSLFQALLWFSSFGLTTLQFYLIYKLVPNARVRRSEALTGGLLAGTLWHIANAVFVWTIPYFHYEHVYGSVWALVVIVVWIYTSCWILLIGAYLTNHLHRFAEPPVHEEPLCP